MGRAILVIALGSAGAALAYVVLGFTAPRGFVDFRDASFDSVLLAFGAAWFFSGLFTLPIAGITWAPLHRYKLDGFLSYAAVAVIAFFLIHLLDRRGGADSDAGRLGAPREYAAGECCSNAHP
jgi:hypothetical protein